MLSDCRCLGSEVEVSVTGGTQSSILQDKHIYPDVADAAP